LKSRLKGYGEWAAVTGCTRGIGKEYCYQLAELGLNIVLIARNEEILKQQATEIEEKYGVKTCVIVVDFDNVDEKLMRKTFDGLVDKDIGILVNNAGVMYDYPNEFYDVSEDVHKKLVNVNVMWPIRLSHFLIKEQMLQKKKGVIIFMSSAAGKQIIPMLTTYGASKAFILYLVRCLVLEFLGTGIHVQAITPYYVATDMTKYNKELNTPGFFNPDAKTYVKSAIKTFGMTSETFGYFPHTIQFWLLCWLPEYTYGWISLIWNRILKKNRC